VLRRQRQQSFIVAPQVWAKKNAWQTFPASAEREHVAFFPDARSPKSSP